jgi:hypothetical protein
MGDRARGAFPLDCSIASRLRRLIFLYYITLNMASEEEPAHSLPSLADRITDRMTPTDEMQIDAEEETDRRNALLDGPLEQSSRGAERAFKDEQDDEDSEEGSRVRGLAGRIAKNRLYTVNETAPDAPDTRVADEVSRSDIPRRISLSQNLSPDPRSGQPRLSEQVNSSPVEGSSLI